MAGNAAKNEQLSQLHENWGILLHRLWVTGEVYEPLRNPNLRQQQKNVAA
jgi:hypothetical protein